MADPTEEHSAEPELMIVLVDTNQNYYELSRATLEQSKIPDDRKEEVKNAIANVLGETGYINNPRIPGSIVGSFVIKAPVHYAGSYLKRGDSRH